MLYDIEDKRYKYSTCSTLPCISLAKQANITADEWATGKFDGRANAHPGPPLATPLVLKPCGIHWHACYQILNQIMYSGIFEYLVNRKHACTCKGDFMHVESEVESPSIFKSYCCRHYHNGGSIFEG